MNEQMIYIGMTIIAVACLFLIYQNYQMRMAHALDISRINKTMKDMGVKNVKNISGGMSEWEKIDK